MASCGVYTANSERLRSAGPAPYGPGKFLTQTFGVDRNTHTVYTAELSVPTKTDDMAGAGGNLISANWQQLPFLTENGSNIYRGSTITKPYFVDKDYVGS